jgi:hypothetical protein
MVGWVFARNETVRKIRCWLAAIAAALPLVGCGSPFVRPSSIAPPIPTESVGELEWTEIVFDDLKPAAVDLYQCWNSMGMDAEGRIYIGFTSYRDGGEREDVVVFRYEPATGERRFLGSFLDVAEAEDNLIPGESIPKGHTRMVRADGRLFMGSQGFHDFKRGIDDLPNHRGSHLFGYDPSRNSWQDLTRVRDLRCQLLREHLGIDTAAMGDREALARYRDVARRNAARRRAGEPLDGLAIALDPATYALQPATSNV